VLCVDPISHTPVASGIGRKFADTLQIFKEISASSIEVEDPLECHRQDSRPSSISSLHAQAEGVAEPTYEFVKRSDWPEREAVAVRREKSMTALQRARTRESNVSSEGEEHRVPRTTERKSSAREQQFSDLVQWRKEVLSLQDGSGMLGRGRRRERLSTDNEDNHPDTYQEYASPLSIERSLSSRASPSSSHSRTSRVRHQPPDLASDVASDHEHISPSKTGFVLHDLSPNSPLASLPSAPVSDSEWTEDDSTWDTGSVTTSMYSTPGPSGGSALLRAPGDEQPTSPQLSRSEQNAEDDEFEDADTEEDISLTHEHLPHIPLRPFRNQVGGHSAIYKFTKRAVCKVRSICPRLRPI